MIHNLKITGVGPAPNKTMELNFGRRLNLLTGDNGLGKSFLLDIIWWALTRKWPCEVNPSLVSGNKAIPYVSDKKTGYPSNASICFTIDGKKGKPFSYETRWNHKDQNWTGLSGRPLSPGLILYAMFDGSFAVWDPARNYWKTKGSVDVQDRPPAYVFGPSEVWNGLSSNGTWLCNGLLRDWASWQKEYKEYEEYKYESFKSFLASGEYKKVLTSDEYKKFLRSIVDIYSRQAGLAEIKHPMADRRGLVKGFLDVARHIMPDRTTFDENTAHPFYILKSVLKTLSPSEQEILRPGSLTRISLDDVRDIPTIRMPYSQEVPVVHASAGIRRIMAIAYLLVWAFEEHKRAAKIIKENATKQIVFLIDEIEAHLHPSWQRKILPALLKVMNEMTGNDTNVQLIAATHSPLVMASAECDFDDKEPLSGKKIRQDAWFDLDVSDGSVTLQRRPFEKHGECGRWLMSEAFDLPSDRPVDSEALINEASALLENENVDIDDVQKMNQKLADKLDARDSFLAQWQYVCRKKGWIQ